MAIKGNYLIARSYEQFNPGSTGVVQPAVSQFRNAKRADLSARHSLHDYSGINLGFSYSRVVFIFDLGIAGDGSPNFTFYFDDIILN